MNGEYSMCSRDECKGYPKKKALLVELLKDHRKDIISRTDGSEECSKFCLGRGSSATWGVKGFYTPGGIHLAHTFLCRAEGPIYVVEMVSHFLVPPIVLITETPCMVRPIMKNRCGGTYSRTVELSPALGQAMKAVLPWTVDDEGTAIRLDCVRLTRPKLRKVSICVLAQMGLHTNRITGCEPTVEVLDIREDSVTGCVRSLSPCERITASPARCGLLLFLGHDRY